MLALDLRSQVEGISRHAGHLWKYPDVGNEQHEMSLVPLK